MEYLTSHDLVWINRVLSGRDSSFDYVTLEAAVGAQYSYGNSRHLFVQAAGLMCKVLNTRPFSAANRRSAWLATVAFLKANGQVLEPNAEVVAQVFAAAAMGRTDLARVLEASVGTDEHTASGAVKLRAMITELCNEHASVISSLTAD